MEEPTSYIVSKYVESLEELPSDAHLESSAKELIGNMPSVRRIMD